MQEDSCEVPRKKMAALAFTREVFFSADLNGQHMHILHVRDIGYLKRVQETVVLPFVGMGRQSPSHACARHLCQVRGAFPLHPCGAAFGTVAPDVFASSSRDPLECRSRGGRAARRRPASSSRQGRKDSSYVSRGPRDRRGRDRQRRSLSPMPPKRMDMALRGTRPWSLTRTTSSRWRGLAGAVGGAGERRAL